MGVDFLWTLWNLWPAWLLVNGALIGIYYVIDRFYFYPHEAARDLRADERTIRPVTVSGLWPNTLLLLGVILSVALLDPTKPLPGTGWHPWLYLREMVQLLLVWISLYGGPAAARIGNKFNYHAILEVAALFIGIFICMQPAIEILDAKGSSLGLDTPAKLFWATGSLSAVLDNAPTYVVFFKTAESSIGAESLVQLLAGTDMLAAEARTKLIGVSLGAVFMGAMTYIGNGPNFMVRAIAEHAGVPMPSFFGYVLRYSFPILIPVLVLVSVLLVR